MASPREPLSDTSAAMQQLAAALDKLLNGDTKGPDRPNGFVLLVFPRAGPEGQRVNYVSNCDRSEMTAALWELATRFGHDVTEP